MGKRLSLVLSVLLTCVFMLTGCLKKDEVISSAEELNKVGMKVGTVQGSAPMYITEEKFPNAEIEYFATVSDGCAAMSSGQLDGFVFTKHVLAPYAAANDSIVLLNDVVGTADVSVAMKMGNTELKAKIDEYIVKAKADGTLEEMMERWTSVSDPVMPELEKPENTEGTLRIATEGLSFPFTYFGDNGVLTGLDIEFGTRLAYYLNMDVTFISMSFDGLFPALDSDNADIVLNEINETPERRETVLFSEPYFSSDVVVAVKNGSSVKTEKKFASLNDFSGEVIGFEKGVSFDLDMRKIVPEYETRWMNDLSSGIEEVKSGKAAAYVTDLPVAVNVVEANPELAVFPQLAFEEGYAWCFPKNSSYLDDFNKALAQLKADGTVDEINSYWIESKNTDKQVEPQKSSGENGTIIIGGSAAMEPMVYMNGEGKIIGREVALCNAVCDILGLKAEYVNIPWDALAESLDSGKADVFIGTVSVTEERKQIMDFCDTTYMGGAALIVRKDRIADEAYANADTSDNRLAGKKIGIMTGSAAVMSVEKEYPDAEVVEINAISDAVEMLKAGKLDYVLSSRSTCKNFAKYNEELCVIDEEVISGDKTAAYIAVNKDNTELLSSINDILERYLEDGTIAAIEENWLGDNAAYDMSNIPQNADAPVLKVGMDVSDEPMDFILNGENAGYDCELIERIAYELGMRVEYENMNFPSLIPALQSGKVDVVISDITATDERREMVDFTVPYYANPQVLLARKDNMKSVEATAEETVSESPEGFIGKLKASFTRTFITENRWKLVLSGLGVTILISLCSFVIGSLWGGVICAGLRSGKKIASVPARVYIRLLQGTPIVVLLMILYYIVFKSFDISAVIVAIIGFSLNLGAYTSEIFRTAIDSVDKGQIEAASAIGFSKFKVFSKIILPQAARNALPVYKGEFISLVKSTSIVGYIAIQDLTKASDIIRSRTYEAFFPLITTAIIYFVVTYIFIVLLNILEKKIDPKRRKRTLKGVDIK